MTRNLITAVLFLVVLVPGVSALSFTEDFEGFGLGGFNPELKPDQDWYDYSEGADIGEVSADPIVINGEQSFHVRADAGSSAPSNTALFRLAGPTQLSEVTFNIAGTTITDDGIGGRQVVAIQSASPVRTLVEFHVFCTDAANPSGCELRVRFDAIDSTGQQLIPASSSITTFNIQILPDWTTGQYQLFVNAVDDGNFPFLELPSNIGRLKFSQASSAHALNVTFDDWFIDGAIEAPTTEAGDIADGLRNFATGIHFSSPASLFLLGLVFLAIITLAVAIPLLALGLDNTILPAMAFFNALTVLWLITIGWWPDWIGIAMIIMVAALVSLVMRRLLMGIRDASTSPGIVAGSLGYFIIATTLLAFSGYASAEIDLPTGSIQTPEDQNATLEDQSFVAATLECAGNIITLGLLDLDCTQKTTGTTFKAITNFASTIFNFARTAFQFLFQLLSFALPIPTAFNAMIVLPPAAALATVGFGFITKAGS